MRLRLFNFVQQPVAMARQCLMILHCDLTFDRFLGLQNPRANPIDILGQFDRTTNALRFAAHVDTPIALLNTDNQGTAGAGPIEQVYFKGAELSLVGNAPHFSIDGSILLRPFTIGSIPPFGLDGATSIDFNSLGIDLPSAPGVGPRLASPERAHHKERSPSRSATARLLGRET